MFDASIIAAAQAHARACFPEESCGLVTQSGYVPLKNVSPEPLEAFDCTDEAMPYIEAGHALALIHSHPNDGRRMRSVVDWPSASDMHAQIAMDIPWGIITLDQNSISKPWFWGKGTPDVPLERRLFRHGPTGTDGKGDCYALIRDWFRQQRQVELPEFPRDWKWWEEKDKTKPGADAYEQGFREAGFEPISAHNVREGDCAMIAIPGNSGGAYIGMRINHAAVYVGAEKVLHHRAMSRSCIEHLGNWNKLIVRWVRHASAK
jgi:cell wall-associated NlpC family hydrolase